GGLFLFACKKPTLSDTALIPENHLDLKFTDTLTVRAITVREDSIDVSSATLCGLGTINDTVFGKISASFYIPFTKNFSDTFLPGTAPLTLDSAVLSLWYFSAYGDWRFPQSVAVYEMTEAMSDTAAYYSNTTFETNHFSIGKKTHFIPNLNDSILLDGEMTVPSLRIMLDKSWGQKFIDSSGTPVFISSDKFRNFFKGLYVTETSGNGKGLVFFDPYVSGVRLTIYYRDAFDSSFHYDFPAVPAYVVNHYEHDYANSTVEDFINRPDTLQGDSLVFIQGLAGVNTRFIVPYLSNLGNILINKAELVLTQITEDTDTSLFKAPPTLIMLEGGTDGNITASPPPDQQFPSSIFGGVKKSETDTAGAAFTRYRFSLSRYYKHVMDGNADFGIFILPEKRYQSPYRLVAGGGSHSKYALKLNLTYTIIE
ncbi:MAG TPA: DUF4270 family protein, partial [Chitinophagales bacterium]|nr:DUF4270 family protein [Chitinophagales bacterium]